ncbi:MAG: leucine--tRNA ligase [Paludibacter sp.]|nr:leucine--tRNA ligase [Paludibacter sp.]MDD4198258.1 leucine--tRNA ligase [Paludibacter sp.]MDD4428040.1 leucine--tRNA ligase [Paludibacter sp.]
MEYNFSEIEAKWQEYWEQNQTYKTEIDVKKPKYYVLDMFPYPSGAGLHVGHPLGYIASDIYSRYKRLQGFNVLHPMGYDAYGLPAEQYAIQTGQHPAVTTAANITRYREQLDKIGFCYDWGREIRTSEPDYYHWTQWAFIQMFNHYFDTKLQKAMPVELLVQHLENNGTNGINAHGTEELDFSAAEWKLKTEKEQQDILLNYRIAYLADLKVNWCPALGTVLANDEVSEGLSIRGGHPVEQKMMRQWSLRVSAYAQRLLDGLSKIDWTDSLKETQKNWIGRSEGAEMTFRLKGKDVSFDIFTTRADTIYGVTFMVLAPESELVDVCTIPKQATEVQHYLEATKKRTERERIADRRITGVFTGSYAINPVSGTEIPVWISDYVLAGYGTGAIMAVPGHDSRDYAFARHFNLPIIPLIEGCDITEESFDAKEGIMMNSGFLNGLTVKEAIEKTKEYVEETGIGKIKVNYRLRDAIFSRQRYWGEPFPVYYKDDMPYMLDESKLPLVLPEVDKFLPTEKGEPPLGRAKNWQTEDGFPLELCTMPGFAGSSAYYLRYMDPKNDKALVSKEANAYWRNVDLYIGGTEHATGHLIYSRFWNKFLFDLGLVCEDEPFKKLINQGMIQGRSNFVYRIKETAPLNSPKGGKSTPVFVSYNLKDQYETTPIHVDVNIVYNDQLDIERFKNWNPEYKNAEFILEEGKYICGWAIEKMSKSMFNVVNPDDIVEKYGADTLRLYEMFLGPLEQSKPWDTNGIDGVHRFLKRLWALFYKDGELLLNNEQPDADELKILHKTIKKVTFDIENFSFNTSVSAFMICLNELSALKCNKRAILEPLVILLAPFAPHIAEELYHILGNTGTVFDADFPVCNEAFLVESTVKYPISFNGKVRFTLELPADMDKAEIEKTTLENENTQKQLNGASIKKVIVVPGKIVNIVI